MAIVDFAYAAKIVEVSGIGPVRQELLSAMRTIGALGPVGTIEDFSNLIQYVPSKWGVLLHRQYHLSERDFTWICNLSVLNGFEGATLSNTVCGKTKYIDDAVAAAIFRAADKFGDKNHEEAA